MARHTRIRLAALATTFVAALGIAAVSPATASHAGHSPMKVSSKYDTCC